MRFVLAGGTGTDSIPFPAVTNNHLLPIYEQPMVYYPLQTLVNADRKILLVHRAAECPATSCSAWATRESA